MSFEATVVETVRELFAINRQPVKTRLIVEHIGDVPGRTVRYHLARLERDGWLERPCGRKQGYVPVPGPRRLLRQRMAMREGLIRSITDAIRKLYGSFGSPVPTRVIVDRVGESRRTIQRCLAQLEEAGYVSRPDGPKSGWVLAQPAAAR